MWLKPDSKEGDDEFEVIKSDAEAVMNKIK